jgi:methyl-accepting chemotaxis protein
MVEQSTAAASSLRSEAVELGQLVGRFRIVQAGAAPSKPAAARPLTLARPGHHTPARNPVAKAQAKITASIGGAPSTWEEF